MLPGAAAINGMIIAAMLSAIRRPEPEQARRLSAAIRALVFEGITA